MCRKVFDVIWWDGKLGIWEKLSTALVDAFYSAVLKWLKLSSLGRSSATDPKGGRSKRAMRVSLCCIDQTRFVQQEWRTSVQWLELSDGTKMYNMYWPAYVMQTGGQYTGWLDAIAQLVLMFQLLRLINHCWNVHERWASQESEVDSATLQACASALERVTNSMDLFRL